MWESTLTCFTTGSLSDLECLIGNGLMGIFGSPIILTIVMLVFGVILCWKLKISFDLTVVFMVSLIDVMVLAFAPVWLKWLSILIVACIVGWGFYKFSRR